MINTLTKFRIKKHILFLNVIFFLLSFCITNISFAEQEEAEDFPWEIFYPAIIKKSIDKDKDLDQWTKLLGTSEQDFGFGIAVDINGNSYITGKTEGDLDGNINFGSDDAFVSKYDTNGNRLWTKLLSSGLQGGFGIAVDTNGNSYIIGYTNGDLDGNINAADYADIFVSKYDTNGSRLWTKLLGTTPQSDWGTGIAVDTNSNSYITGYTGGNLGGNTNAGDYDIFIWKVADLGM